MNIYRRKNIVKTWMIMTGFFVFIIFFGYIASNYFDNRSILYGAVGFSIVSNFFSYFFSDKVALSMSGAKKADLKTKNGEKLIKSVEKISRIAKIKIPEIYIIEDKSMNAFATGRGPNKSAIALSSGLIETLNKEEIEGVIAHEISHIKNRDILLMTTIVTLVGVFVIISDLFFRNFFKKKTGLSKTNAATSVIIVIFSILAQGTGGLVKSLISRKREYLADASGARLTHNPNGLASALEKISNQARPMKKASMATAHMFISNPFFEGREDKTQFIKRIFSTHPPIEKRISRLRGEPRLK